jgi:hypothetical protein
VACGHQRLEILHQLQTRRGGYKLCRCVGRAVARGRGGTGFGHVGEIEGTAAFIGATRGNRPDAVDNGGAFDGRTGKTDGARAIGTEKVS